MSEFPAATPSPGAVHPRARELTGHQPHWHRKRYLGGLERTDHYRTCSYCRCIHPADLMGLLRSGRSVLLESKPATSTKRILMTPNPMRGRKVTMGSYVGPVFDRAYSQIALAERLSVPAGEDWDPSPNERLSGHFERPSTALAPEWIVQPFFFDHTTDLQWREIEAAITQGNRNAPVYPAA